MAQCRTCHQEIVWGKTAAGKTVPMDPSEKRYLDRGDGVYVMVDVHLSHFATCPQADQHRKPLPGSTEDYLKED